MKPIGTHNYFVYIITNINKSVLYTGVTNDIARRIYEHEHNIGGGKTAFTQKYKCFYLLYYERYQYIDHAIKREKEIKGWTRKKKENLIEQLNPDWKFLDPS